MLFSFRQRRRRIIRHSAGRSVTLMMMVVTVVYAVIMMSNKLRRCRVVIAPIATPSFAIVVRCGRGAVMMLPARNVTGGDVGRMITRRPVRRLRTGAAFFGATGAARARRSRRFHCRHRLHDRNDYERWNWQRRQRATSFFDASTVLHHLIAHTHNTSQYALT